MNYPASGLKPDGALPAWLKGVCCLAACCALLLCATGLLAEDAGRYLRVVRDASQTAIALDTGVVHLVSRDEPGFSVDLVAAVHVADKGYYDRLNALFKNYDRVLFELVAPKDTKLDFSGPREAANPVSATQLAITRILGLSFQLECVDYAAGNFVHADMSPEEFNESMVERNESFMKIFFRAWSVAQMQSLEPARRPPGPWLAAAAAFKPPKIAGFKAADGARVWGNGIHFGAD